MAVPELGLANIRRFCEARTPAHLRDEMRLEATPRGNSITIADCRPRWQGAPGEWTRMNIAQVRYDPATHLWTPYWADRNSRWHRYDDLEPTDPTCIFWG